METYVAVVKEPIVFVKAQLIAAAEAVNLRDALLIPGSIAAVWILRADARFDSGIVASRAAHFAAVVAGTAAGAVTGFEEDLDVVEEDGVGIGAVVELEIDGLGTADGKSEFSMCADASGCAKVSGRGYDRGGAVERVVIADEVFHVREAITELTIVEFQPHVRAALGIDKDPDDGILAAGTQS